MRKMQILDVSEEFQHFKYPTHPLKLAKNADLDVWDFKIFNFLDSLCPKWVKCRFGCFRRFQDFQLFGLRKMSKMQIWMFQKIFRFSTLQAHPKIRKMQIWKFQKIFYFSDPLCLKEEKFRFRCFSRFQDFQLFGPQSLNEKNADLEVSEDFLLFRSPLPKRRKMQIWCYRRFQAFQLFEPPKWEKCRFGCYNRF